MDAARMAIVLRLDGTRIAGLDIAARDDPCVARTGQTLVDIDRDLGVRIGARRVIDGHGRFIGRRMDGHLAEGDANVREQQAGRIDLARAGAFAGRDGVGDGGLLIHGLGS